jgi:hypothetical protein
VLACFAGPFKAYRDYLWPVDGMMAERTENAWMSLTGKVRCEVGAATRVAKGHSAAPE